MEAITDLMQARRLRAQLRSEAHQLKANATEAEAASLRWRLNYFEMQEKVGELEAAAKQAKSAASKSA